jgi:hypothetical protein
VESENYQTAGERQCFFRGGKCFLCEGEGILALRLSPAAGHARLAWTCLNHAE